jgi:hypothetical protein
MFAPVCMLVSKMCSAYVLHGGPEVTRGHIHGLGHGGHDETTW